jgi:hypothetical protein
VRQFFIYFYFRFLLGLAFQSVPTDSSLNVKFFVWTWKLFRFACFTIIYCYFPAIIILDLIFLQLRRCFLFYKKHYKYYNFISDLAFGNYFIFPTNMWKIDSILYFATYSPDSLERNTKTAYNIDNHLIWWKSAK